jgi:hypothetical protein
MRHPLLTVVGLALLVGLAACGETPQAAGTRTVGSPAYIGTGSSAYTAGGWKAGDETSWEEGMRARTQSGQNEYVRSGGR